MVVLGHLDERGRVASDLCSGSVPAGAAAYDATVQALGDPRDPLPGRSMVALDATDAQEVLWAAAREGNAGLLDWGWLAMGGRLVLPSKMAFAARSRAQTVASSVGT